MGATKEIFLRMREHDFNSLSTETRELFISVEVRDNDEWEQHKDDVNYTKLKKIEKKAKVDVQKYLFEKRHK